MNYIPASQVSAFCKRHTFNTNFKDTVVQIISTYNPDLWQELNGYEADEELSDKEIPEEKAAEYQKAIESVVYQEPAGFTEKEKEIVIKDRGTFLETDTIERIVKDPGLRKKYGAFKVVRQTGVKKYFTVGGPVLGSNKPVADGYCISGNIDGIIWNKCIIEIKNRCDHFYAPQHDFDQLVTYMILFSIPLPGRLVQQCNGELLISDEISYADAVDIWSNQIKPKIDKGITKVERKLYENKEWFTKK